MTLLGLKARAGAREGHSIACGRFAGPSPIAALHLAPAGRGRRRPAHAAFTSSAQAALAILLTSPTAATSNDRRASRRVAQSAVCGLRRA